MNLIAIRIIKKLILKKLNISFVESCTGGLLSYSLTKNQHASKIYSFGMIAYSNNSKKKLLQISKKVLEKHGAVSRSVCIAMVKNLNKIAKTDISISTTGIAGPGGGSSQKPIGLVFVAIKFKKKTICKKFIIENKSRNYIQKKAVYKTLKLLDNLIK